jgi:lipid-A-disaccharide synthase-like uncharacterized protein
VEDQVTHRKRTIAALVAIVVLAIGWTTHAQSAAESTLSVDLRLKPLPAGVKSLRIEAAPDGSHTVVMVMTDGGEERLRPDEFIARIDRDTRGRSFLFRLLNITGPVGIAWVVLGLLGQVIFAGRMVVQWLVSEKQKRSVVPVAFWWMSLAGASMMLVYFIWRRDIVGVLGQSTGWVIYVRNLWLIYRDRLAAQPSA